VRERIGERRNGGTERLVKEREIERVKVTEEERKKKQYS
jgi:hypothetical protein